MPKNIIFCIQEGNLTELAFPAKFKKHVICSGNMIGYVKYIKKMIELFYKYENVWEKLGHDDQLILGYVIKKEPDFFKKNVAYLAMVVLPEP